jgi:UDP-N-acetylglucosamine 2-epimerase (non-hydrolysing)
MKNIAILVGARPNYMKAFPIYRLLKNTYNVTLIHSGQHYDQNLKDVFFRDFCMTPDVQFIMEATTEVTQLAETIQKLGNYIAAYPTDLLMVFGDVTTTLAGALVANKLKVKLCHIESGLRSFDKTMPEENNRILVDHISNMLFVTEQSGLNNLKNEGITDNVYFVGNTMIDSLVYLLNNTTFAKTDEKYILVTLHRQSNVDDICKLTELVDVLNELSKKYTIYFPVHHRTRNNLNKTGLTFNDNIKVLEPLGYIEFMNYMTNSALVITDSGGIQEETTFLGISCVTLRDNTERPSTLRENGGTNILSDINNIIDDVTKWYDVKTKTDIRYWDGYASARICDQISKLI